MKLAEKYASWFQKYLPSPFSIAIILTIVAALLAFVFSDDKDIVDHLTHWQNGLWATGLLVFAFQMMLMLVLGHVLALSSFFDSIVNFLIKPLKTNGSAAAAVAFFAILISFLNWGLSLIFGAILARKVGEKFSEQGLPLNYGLVGAAGFSGMMTWHGGLSGSAPLKVAEVGHLNDITRSSAYPEAISVAETIFSPMNIIVFVILLVAIPMLIHNIAKRSNAARVELTKTKLKPPLNTNASGAERIDQLWWLSKGLGMGMAALAIYIAVTYRGSSFGFLNPNYINFCLLAACLWLHTNFSSFLQAVDEAIKGASGILIQFPIYFGILALMQSGGLISLLSDSFIAFSNTTSLPILALISSGIVNVFVPSGGGQWAIQGPVLLEAASQIGVPLPKIIMAMAYGDELTNMLQPFWALPLLSITGLNAKQILPYTILIMMLGFIVFCLGLLLF